MKTLAKLKKEVTHSSSLVTLLTNQALQTRLLDFVADPFITELLTGITKYMLLSEKPDLKKHAQEKAASLFS